ncbi:MAG: methylated-DNA--[protein]-cysteine S-methyltransferase [Acidobacteria bacterium]|nr:methylated-DNA--[protein]-cysteine S-methyltransferase [Acidobacteriota bacterium]
MMVYRVIDSPIGPLMLAASDGVLRRLAFVRDGMPPPEPDWARDLGELDDVVRQLEAYFAGRLKQFTIPVGPHGTPFQQRVWTALQQIPYGETTSYGALARRIGAESAVRAVGAANGANPIAVIIPCHRVIGADGSLTGFGGGLPTKRALLELEQGIRRML